MADDPRLERILDRIFDSQCAPEDACGDCPELLPAVRHRLHRMQAVGGQIAELFPPPSTPVPDDATLQQVVALPQIAGYDVQALLGQGGMGIVYRAVDQQLQRPVAIKLLRPELANSVPARERFQREARAMAALVHDHVVAIYEVGADQGVPYIAMPLLHGETLEDRLCRAGALPLPELLRIGAEIAEGLAAAHAHGLVHRDVKPANVWLEGERGRVKLLDLGLARPVGISDLTMPGIIAGTPHYMSPEQARGEELDARSDLFSLGTILYRMASGTLPFAGANSLAVLRAVQEHEPLPCSGRQPAVPVGLDQHIRDLLTKDRALRPASAADVARRLRGLAGDTTAPFTPVLSTRQHPGDTVATAPGARRRPLVFNLSVSRTACAVSATLAILALAVSLWVWFSRPAGDSAIVPVDPGSLPLKGSIDLRILRPEGDEQRVLGLDDPGALPLRQGKDYVRLEARMNRPAYLYVVWVDTDGHVYLVYPWDEEKERRPPDEQMVDHLYWPSADRGGLVQKGPAGTSSLVLLARDTRLPEDTDIGKLFGDLGPQKSMHRHEAAWFENGELLKDGELIDGVRRHLPRDFAPDDRGPLTGRQTLVIDDPVLRLQGLLRTRLKGEFAYSRAVCFASDGDRAWADGPPLVVHGELKATDPADRVQKHSYARVHAFELKAGEAILAHLRSIDFDAVLRVEDANGKVLGRNDDILAGMIANSRLGFVAPAAGNYRLVVTSFDPGRIGEYVLEVAALEPVGDAATVAGELTAQSPTVQGQRYHGHELTAQAGRWYLFDLTSPDFEPQLVLRYDAGQPLAHDRGGGMGSGARLVWPADKAGPWQLQVRGVRPDAAGKYLLQWRPYRGALKAELTEREKLSQQAVQWRGRVMASYRAGRYSEALEVAEESLTLRRKLFPAARYPDGHRALAKNLNDLGELLSSAGQHKAAREYLEQAVAMCRRLYPKGHGDLAICLSNLGELLRKLGQYEAARGYLDEALAMQGQLYPQGHSDLAITLNNLGGLLQAAGQPEEAREYLQQAVAMNRKLFPEAQYPRGHRALANSLNNLGALLWAVGQYDGARSYLEQGLAMKRKLYPEAEHPQGHPELVRGMNNLGVLLSSAGQGEKAREYHEQALAMCRKLYPAPAYPQGHPDFAATLHNLGLLLRKQERPEAARDCLKQALAMNRKLYPVAQYPQGHQALATSLSNLGAVWYSAGQYDAARDCLRPSAAMSQALARRDMILAPEAEALHRLRHLPFIRDASLSSGLRAGAAADELYAELWPTRGMLSRLLQRRHQATRAAQAGDPKVRRAWVDLALVRGELNRLLTQPSKDPAAQDKELARVTARKEQLERELAYLLPELRRARELDDLGPADLAAVLPDGYVFVDLVRYTQFGKDLERAEKYLAFVVSRDGPIKLVALKEAAPIDSALRAWRGKIEAYKDTAADARAFAALVWDPIARELPAGTKGVYVAPDSALAGLPWAALPGMKAGTVLLEELAVAVVPHGPFLLEQLKYPPQFAAGKELVVGLGGVDYGAAKLPAYTPLPGTAAELGKLAELAGQRPVELLQQGEARWDNLKEALPRARYAHLATHGFYDAKALRLEQQRLADQWKRWQFGADPEYVRAGQGTRSPLAFTGLVLAGANTSAKDAVVTGEALIELPLEDLRLCVLSACESDLGPLAGEGVQGLPRALHLAGCRDVIASLWNVNDRATAALMAKLYDGLWREGKTPLEALRQAQLLVYRHPDRIADLAERGRPTGLKTLRLPIEPAAPAQRAATKLWAGFVLSGAGR
jgi:serine/threonine protein kinase/CHAT domain-containing protein/tetratricopeptide (TPR) repeat protein